MISEWSSGDLLRFIQQTIRDDDTVAGLGRTANTFTVTRKLSISDEIVFQQTQTTVGTAGAASALPATPDLYAKATGPDGIVRLIPMYKIP